MNNYPKFPSIERIENIYCIITEKIDGTNGLIESGPLKVKFGSRNRYLSSNEDNAGFMNFYKSYICNISSIHYNIHSENEILMKPTDDIIRIYGEWFGLGIQRNYGLQEKRFMPFSSFYAEKMIEQSIPNIVMPEVLYKGKFNLEELKECMKLLETHGSVVVPGFMKPEGVVIHFPKYNFNLKQTFTGPKWSNKDE